MASHAVVTGGGSGIGLAIARALAGAGHRVTIMGRNPARLDGALASLPGAAAIACDVADAASVEAAFGAAAERQGTVGILVNALALQGGPHPAPFFRAAEAPHAAPLPPQRPALDPEAVASTGSAPT